MARTAERAKTIRMMLMCKSQDLFLREMQNQIRKLENPNHPDFLQKENSGKVLVTTSVYAKCDANERLELSDSIYALSNNMNYPLLVGGDFNVITNKEEKIGGLPVYHTKFEDFAFCMNSCELTEVEFRGSPFTWWNGRAGDDCIFKRLDRILVNSHFLDWFGNLSMEHLSRTGLDHAPLLLTLITRENIVKIKEQHFEEDPFEVNRMVLQQAQAEFKRYLHFEEEFWRQKSGIQWHTEGDRNTRFFHSLVNGRRKSLQLTIIQNGEGDWIDNSDFIANVAIELYQRQFTQEATYSDYSILEHVQESVTQEQNSALCSMPSLEEVKRVVFELAGYSACGPDGFSEVSLQRIMGVLHEYELASGQKINVDKNAFYMHKNVPSELIQDVQQTIGFTRGNFLLLILDVQYFMLESRSFSTRM
ncbi:uncharacterized protein LOC132035072 [Lycium ferocissimum]|uniref:uncharacterized protein LOC132035072 n=1 Tax=Lycium ferocissimum TaxID=112874 RepID=UPI002814A292|nr:uncharacterized protein LOC132035072 [Lycium ferocissimum]